MYSSTQSTHHYKQEQLWFGEPRIIETYALIQHFEPVTKRHWIERGESTGFEVIGGSWFRRKYATRKQAEKELDRRNRLITHPKN